MTRRSEFGSSSSTNYLIFGIHREGWLVKSEHSEILRAVKELDSPQIQHYTQNLFTTVLIIDSDLTLLGCSTFYLTRQLGLFFSGSNN